MNYKKKEYTIVFNYQRETEKAFHVRKKTKKKDDYYWIPKSVVTAHEKYDKKKNLPEDCSFTINRISLTIKSWYVKKELGFTM